MLRQILGQAKKHPSLIPLFVFIGAGGTGAALYVLRLAMFNPDVSWDRKNNPEPWNKMAPNEQYKDHLLIPEHNLFVGCNVQRALAMLKKRAFDMFYSVNVDYNKLKKEGPDF